MPIRWISETDVRSLEPAALGALSAHLEMVLPALAAPHPPDREQPIHGGHGAESFWAPMDAALDPAGSFGIELGETTRHRDPQVFAVYDPTSKAVQSFVSGSALQFLAPFAEMSLFSRLLSQPHAYRLGIMGSVHFARWVVAAVRPTRPIRHVRLWDREPEDSASPSLQWQEHPNLDITRAGTAESVVGGAHIVVTDGNDPIPDPWLQPGTLVLAPSADRLANHTLSRAECFTLAPQGELGEQSQGRTDIRALSHGSHADPISSAALVVAWYTPDPQMDMAIAYWISHHAEALHVGTELPR